MMRCSGICRTTSRFSAVLSEHPFTPTNRPSDSSSRSSSAVPVKLCTTPTHPGSSAFGSPLTPPLRRSAARWGHSTRTKSACAARECRKSGRRVASASVSWASNAVFWASAGAKCRRS